jgi:hypothetical protein
MAVHCGFSAVRDDVRRAHLWLCFITADAFAYLAAVVPVRKALEEDRYSVGAVYKMEVREDLTSREITSWKEQSDMSRVCDRTVRQSIK